MTWDTFHRRVEVLRTVVDHLDAHPDGRLPVHLPGVAEVFPDELTLLGALQMRWHTRLAGAIERELMDRPPDLETVVTCAWRRASTELAGIRAALDAYTAEPTSGEMRRVLAKAQQKDWQLLAAMAGGAGPADSAAGAVGRRIEQRAREAHRPSMRTVRRSEARTRNCLLGRLKAHLVA